MMISNLSYAFLIISCCIAVTTSFRALPIVEYSNPCRSDEFECLDKKFCIPNQWVCDQYKQCRDGSDESFCSFRVGRSSTGTQLQLGSRTMTVSCRKGEFFCPKDGFCFPIEWRCDGTEDCIGGTDEKNCQNIKCLDNQITCEGTAQCIFPEWVCDGHKDCTSGSDEQNCS